MTAIEWERRKIQLYFTREDTMLVVQQWAEQDFLGRSNDVCEPSHK